MRLPESPLLGLMWVDPAREDPLNLIRHEAQQRDGEPQLACPVHCIALGHGSRGAVGWVEWCRVPWHVSRWNK